MARVANRKAFVVGMTEDEKALYAELVVQIAVRMGKVRIDRSADENNARKERFDIKGRIIEHGSLSDFEAGCAVLKDLGVLQPLNPDDTPHEDKGAWTASYRIEFDMPELRDYLDGTLPGSRPSLSEVIRAFLGLTTNYDCEVSVWREPFAPPHHLEPAFDLFERCGYVDRIDGMVTWSDEITPEMRAIYAWDEHGAVREDMAEAEIAAMRMSLPPDIRNAFFSGGPVDIDALSVVIAGRWYYGEWHDVPLDEADERVTLHNGATGKAKALAKKFRIRESSYLSALKSLFTGRVR